VATFCDSFESQFYLKYFPVTDGSLLLLKAHKKILTQIVKLLVGLVRLVDWVALEAEPVLILELVRLLVVELPAHSRPVHKKVEII
jgi:hypothetical protein